jgi:hypothetical protein
MVITRMTNMASRPRVIILDKMGMAICPGLVDDPFSI